MLKIFIKKTKKNPKPYNSIWKAHLELDTVQVITT